jgi:hypothetical protein
MLCVWGSMQYVRGDGGSKQWLWSGAGVGCDSLSMFSATSWLSSTLFLQWGCMMHLRLSRSATALMELLSQL